MKSYDELRPVILRKTTTYLKVGYYPGVRSAKGVLVRYVPLAMTEERAGQVADEMAVRKL